MKRLLVILMMVFSLEGFAQTSKQSESNALIFGVGAFGPRGVLGLSYDYFLNSNHALSGALAIDLVGLTSTLGYKYFLDPAAPSGNVWDKCLFLFECDARTYFGASLQRSGAVTQRYLEDGVEINSYRIGASWFEIVSVGRRVLFPNGFTYDLEFSYRNIFAGGETELLSGAPTDGDQNRLTDGRRSIGFSIGLGYTF